MKKMIFVVMGLLIAASAFADDNINKNEIDLHNTVNDTVTTTATSDAAAIARQKQMVNSYNGNFVTPGTHAPVAPTTPLNDYGHLITQMPTDAFMISCEPFTRETVEVMARVVVESGPGETWETMNSRIIGYPFLKKAFSPLNGEPVYFIDAATFYTNVAATAKAVPMGGYAYNSKYRKDNPVLPQYYNLRAYEDASRYGANVVVRYDQFAQKHFTDEAFDWSLAGTFSAIWKFFSRAIGITGSGGYTEGKNTESDRTGAAYLFFRIEGFNPAVCLVAPTKGPEPKPTPAPTPKPICSEQQVQDIITMIRAALEACDHCPRDCFNNEAERKRAGDGYIQLYKCTGDKRYLILATYQYQMVEANFRGGHEPDGTKTSALKGAQIVYKQTHENWAWALNEIKK